jgi:hypothetical protein
MLAEKMFAEGVVKQIKDYLPPEYQEMDYRVTERLKNNDTCRVGVSISSPDEETERVIYVEPFYEAIKDGESLEGVMEKIAGQIKGSDEINSQIQGMCIKDFQQAKSRLSVTLINTNANRRTLSHMPHKEIEDLSMICQISGPVADGMGMLSVTDDIQKMWKVSKETLFDTALANVRESDSYVMHELSSIVNETIMGSMFTAENILNVPEEAVLNSKEPMYVLTNTDRIRGASVLLCPKVMDKVSRMFPEGFYLLPSSIHEILVLPKDAMHGYDAASLGSLVREVNETQVDREEVLSDRIYEYDKSCGAIRQVPESIDRRREMER